MECEPNHFSQIGTFDKTSAGSDDFCYISLRKTENGLNWEKLEKCMYKQHVYDSKSSYQMNLVHSFAHINMQTSIFPGVTKVQFILVIDRKFDVINRTDRTLFNSVNNL